MKGRIVYGKSGATFYLNGHIVPEEAFRTAFPSQPLGSFGGHLPSCWPMRPSEALGVHKNQVAEARADAQCKGVPTEFTQDGRPIFTDRSHRRKYLRAYRFHDNRGGYGDG